MCYKIRCYVFNVVLNKWGFKQTLVQIEEFWIIVIHVCVLQHTTYFTIVGNWVVKQKIKYFE